MSTPRRLLARLRHLMAHGPAPLPELVRLVAAELVSEVCSIYVVRHGETLELAATEGLNPEAIGRTRLRIGEGIVGLVAATGRAENLPDAQNHPAWAYRPETGEERYASLLAVPVRRAGRQGVRRAWVQPGEPDPVACHAGMRADVRAAGAGPHLRRRRSGQAAS